MILNILGQPGSGKTTISNLWKTENPSWFQVDGDHLRDILPNKNYTISGRYDNIRRANTIATYLDKQGKDVVISLMNPFRELRFELKNLNPEKVFSVYLTSDRDLRREFHYENFEPPKMDESALHIDTTDRSIDLTYKMIYESFYHYTEGR